ncbi:hypothetical protein GIS00_04435 [Nakamurella sp. YIM 132087]|uniref:Uncharacterized protein n=1 Tax=Nakamurella alba TaxID=2665158 RepID=A0A7K1FK12_9ACTN|nr:hypothetical protein [Nakamurella alba]MTD13194.1 hypothetical protein [Nakamurella alba]
MNRDNRRIVRQLDRTPPAGRNGLHANNSPRIERNPRHRSIEMSLMLEELARDRMRQVQRDVEQARTARRHRRQRSAR